MDREEIISALVANYKAELATLSDDELLSHWQMQQGVQQMTEHEWRAIMAKQNSKLNTGD